MKMVFVFTFLLIAGLEMAYADDVPNEPVQIEDIQEPDMCVGCDDDKEEEPLVTEEPMVVEIHINPLTGEVRYIIKELVIE
jgi:hypothetical protein